MVNYDLLKQSAFESWAKAILLSTFELNCVSPYHLAKAYSLWKGHSLMFIMSCTFPTVFAESERNIFFFNQWKEKILLAVFSQITVVRITLVLKKIKIHFIKIQINFLSTIISVLLNVWFLYVISDKIFNEIWLHRILIVIYQFKAFFKF